MACNHFFVFSKNNQCIKYINRFLNTDNNKERNLPLIRAVLKNKIRLVFYSTLLHDELSDHKQPFVNLQRNDAEILR